MAKSLVLNLINPKRNYSMKRIAIVALTLASISAYAVEITDLEKAIRYSQVVQASIKNNNESQACVAQTGLVEALKNANMIDALEIAKMEQTALCNLYFMNSNYN